MARLRPLTKDEVSDPIRQLFEQVERAFGVPSVTAGIQADRRQVLGRQMQPIVGLYAAGGAGDGVIHEGYAGAGARAVVSRIDVGTHAASEGVRQQPGGSASA